MIARLPLILVLLMAGVFSAKGQYWFGPRVGVHRVDHIYQESTYKTDSFNVKANYNYQFGVVFDYTASDKYSVHTEINYERVETDLKNKIGSLVRSNTNYSFITVPLMLRVSFGRAPSHWYVNGGPKLSFWVAGSGDILDASFEENPNSPRKYKMTFAQGKTNAETEKAVVQANRVQYALALGAGSYLDLAVGGRLNFDMRYTFGHSNMGFNNNPDFTTGDYTENFKFRNFMLSTSVSYILEYNAKLQRKGSSTNKESRKK